MKKKKSVKLLTLLDDGSMDSTSGEASQAEFQGELAKALVLPLVGGEWSGICFWSSRFRSRTNNENEETKAAA